MARALEPSVKLKCRRCGRENPPGLEHCGQCGSALLLRCRSCNSVNERGNRRCFKCGARLRKRRSGGIGKKLKALKRLAWQIGVGLFAGFVLFKLLMHFADVPTPVE